MGGFVSSKGEGAYPAPFNSFAILRHSYASFALQAGETVLTIGRLLGHSNPGTTLKYIHLEDHTVRAAVDAVAPVLGGEG